MKRDPRGKLDRGLAKWFGSRKFTMAVVATFGLFLGHLTGSEWTVVVTSWGLGQSWIDRQKHHHDHVCETHEMQERGE